jgi:hypothetical protein
MVVHACNPSTWEEVADNHKFKARLGYIAGPCLKINSYVQWFAPIVLAI